jgi:hypothetical protein
MKSSKIIYLFEKMCQSGQGTQYSQKFCHHFVVFMEETLSPINTKSSLGSWPPTPTLKKKWKNLKKWNYYYYYYYFKNTGFIIFFLLYILKGKGKLFFSFEHGQE